MTVKEIEKWLDKRKKLLIDRQLSIRQEEAMIEFLLTEVKRLQSTKEKNGMSTGDIGDYHYKIIELKAEVKRLQAIVDGSKDHLLVSSAYVQGIVKENQRLREGIEKHRVEAKLAWTNIILIDDLLGRINEIDQELYKLLEAK